MKCCTVGWAFSIITRCHKVLRSRVCAWHRPDHYHLFESNLGLASPYLSYRTLPSASTVEMNALGTCPWREEVGESFLGGIEVILVVPEGVVGVEADSSDLHDVGKGIGALPANLSRRSPCGWLCVRGRQRQVRPCRHFRRDRHCRTLAFRPTIAGRPRPHRRRHRWDLDLGDLHP